VKVLVCLGDGIWVRPSSIEAIEDLGWAVRIYRHGSSEPLVVEAVTVQDILDKMDSALRQFAEVAERMTGAER